MNLSYKCSHCQTDSWISTTIFEEICDGQTPNNCRNYYSGPHTECINKLYEDINRFNITFQIDNLFNSNVILDDYINDNDNTIIRNFILDHRAYLFYIRNMNDIIELKCTKCNNIAYTNGQGRVELVNINNLNQWQIKEKDPWITTRKFDLTKFHYDHTKSIDEIIPIYNSQMLGMVEPGCILYFGPQYTFETYADAIDRIFQILDSHIFFSKDMYIHGIYTKQPITDIQYLIDQCQRLYNDDRITAIGHIMSDEIKMSKEIARTFRIHPELRPLLNSKSGKEAKNNYKWFYNSLIEFRPIPHVKPKKII